MGFQTKGIVFFFIQGNLEPVFCFVYYFLARSPTIALQEARSILFVPKCPLLSVREIGFYGIPIRVRIYHNAVICRRSLLWSDHDHE